MKEFSIKNIFQFNFLIFILSQIKCEENFTENKRDIDRSDINLKPEPEPEPEPQPDMIKVLEELKEDIQDISKEIAQYDTLIYILIPFATLLFLIFGAFILYEIIKCCKKKESELNEETKNISFVRSDNNNLSKSKNSLTDSSSLRNDKNNQVKNSFQYSKESENLESIDKKNYEVSNSLNIKENIIESNNNSNKIKNGYEAPPIEEINNIKNLNNEEKFLTNNGEEN